MRWPLRPWSPHQVIDNADGTRSIRLSTKRACDGCQTLLGDLTDAELVAAVRLHPLNTVTTECGLCQGYHLLFADPVNRPPDWSPEQPDRWTAKILCPGVPDATGVLACADWQPCGCVAPADRLTVEFEEFTAAPCPHSPTGEHRWLSNCDIVAAPVNECWYQKVEGLTELTRDLVTGPGVYPVELRIADDDSLVIEAPASCRRDATPARA